MSNLMLTKFKDKMKLNSTGKINNNNFYKERIIDFSRSKAKNKNSKKLHKIYWNGKSMHKIKK